MAVKKLTLSAEEDVIKLAHEIAKSENTSISGLFSTFIKARHRKFYSHRRTPMTDKALGMIELPQNYDHKNDLADILSTKYGI